MQFPFGDSFKWETQSYSRQKWMYLTGKHPVGFFVGVWNLINLDCRALPKPLQSTRIEPWSKGPSQTGFVWKWASVSPHENWSSHGKYHLIGSIMINNGIIGAFSPKFSDKPIAWAWKNPSIAGVCSESPAPCCFTVGSCPSTLGVVIFLATGERYMIHVIYFKTKRLTCAQVTQASRVHPPIYIIYYFTHMCVYIYI